MTLDDVAVPMETLSNAIRMKLREKPDLLLVLTIEPAAPYAALVKALDQVKLAGARQVSIQTGGAS